MKAIKLSSTKKMSREEWLEIRKRGITGSRIAGVMNQSPWETPRSVYLDLLGLKPEREQTEPMYWGIRLEDTIAQEFAKRTGMKVRKVNYVLQHPTFEFLLGNIDRLIVDGKEKGILECKNVGAYSADEWRAGPPAHYCTQLQFYLLLTGLSFGYLAALIGGQKFIYYRVERDEAFIQQMIESATEYWYANVEAKQEPPVSEKDTELLNQMFGRVDPGKIVNLSGAEFEQLTREAEFIKTGYQLAETQYDRLINHLKDLMKEAELLTVDGGKLATWKENKNGKRTFRLLI